MSINIKPTLQLLFLLVFSLTTVTNIAAGTTLNTEPEKIVSITQKLYEMDYYHTQVELWNKETNKDKKDAYAWMNYYLACRIVNLLTTENNPHDLQKIYTNLETKIKDTYEYHYLTYLNGKGNTSLFHHLETAYAIDPQRTEVLSHFVAYYAINGDSEKMAFYNELWLKSGEISAGIINWNYNALIGLEENAILLTNGDNDTYPSWMLQQVEGIRTDVEVINIHLLRNSDYMNQVFANCKIPKLQQAKNSSLSQEDQFLDLVDHIFQNVGRPVYVNVTLPKIIRDNYKDVLYTVGLAFKYSTNSFDNIAILKNNYEQKFLIDYLKVGFSYDKSVSVLNSMNVNYLPAFISLYKHYDKSEENSKAESIKKIIENIGEASGRKDEITNILEKSKRQSRYGNSHIDMKNLDGSIMKITPQLYALNTETTNGQYEQFLLDLLQEKEFEKLEKFKNDKVDWMSLLPEKFKRLPQTELFVNGHPDDEEASVVNISYEAAEAYCEWLTTAYNSYPKKKKFKEVVFRLPTEVEWLYASKNKNKISKYKQKHNIPTMTMEEFTKEYNQSPEFIDKYGEIYPWGGYYAVNSKGCYLANFDCSDVEPCETCERFTAANDGVFFISKADSYFPNDFGLYGLSGNAAEMVQGGSIAKGGSWQDPPEECTLSSTKEVKGPSPAIGFRVFMEVIAHNN